MKPLLERTVEDLRRHWSAGPVVDMQLVQSVRDIAQAVREAQSNGHRAVTVEAYVSNRYVAGYEITAVDKGIVVHGADFYRVRKGERWESNGSLAKRTHIYGPIPIYGGEMIGGRSIVDGRLFLGSIVERAIW